MSTHAHCARLFRGDAGTIERIKTQRLTDTHRVAAFHACWWIVFSKKCNGIRRRQARRSDGAASGAVVADGPLDGDTGGSHRQAGQKECTMCARPVDLLIRCTIDVSGRWEMVCGRCWRGVSGGVTDGDAAHPFYRYGGLWKNRKARTHTVGV